MFFNKDKKDERQKTKYLSISILITLKLKSNGVKLLGIKFDKNLTFKKHISELCKRASYKLHTLRRIKKYLNVEKAKILSNAFINSQFNYVAMIWMFANKSSIEISQTEVTIFRYIKNTCDTCLLKFINPWSR